MSLDDWGIISTIVLSVIAIWQHINNLKQSHEKNAEIKAKEFLLTNWHNISEGMKNALFQISQNPDKFSDKKDVLASVNILTQIVVSMTQAMEEQRFFSTDEVKEMRKKKQEEFARRMEMLHEQFKANNKSS